MDQTTTDYMIRAYNRDFTELFRALTHALRLA